MKPTISQRIRTRLADEVAQPTRSDLVGIVRQECPGISDYAVFEAIREIEAEVHGAGPLEFLLDIPHITDVLVNGADDVWIDGPQGLTNVESPFSNDDHVRIVAARLASMSKRRLDDSNPCVDGFFTRRDGTKVRLHAIIPPLAKRPCISLRVLGGKAITIENIVSRGTVSEWLASQLKMLVRNKKSFLISGGTGAGKTTLLTALLSAASEGERIICVEDTQEITPRHPHVVTLTTTTANVEGKGEIGTAQLVKQALRMRPDRIIVGEIRGIEISDLLTALNTGHRGGAGTIHANGPAEIPARCQALGSLAGMSPSTTHEQLKAAIQAVIHIEKRADTRKVVALGVLENATKATSHDTHVALAWTLEHGLTEKWPKWEELMQSQSLDGVMIPC